MKTPTLFKEYIWLVNTIRRAGRISLAELNARWLETEMSGGLPLARTTFNRHKDAIEDIFGLYIDCDRRGGYKYFIGNESVLREESVQNWMLSMLTVNQLVSESLSLRQRILLEDVPSGGEALKQVLDAMKQNRRLSIRYRKYQTEQMRTYVVDPYCVKLFRRRWYLLVKYSDGRMAVFSFDRLLEVQPLDEHFVMDEDFDAGTFFADSFGVMVSEEVPTEQIIVRAFGREPCYLRDLPLHTSQRLLTTTEEYTDFEYWLRPTADFKAHLLSRGAWLQVLSPAWLAAEMKELLRQAVSRYEDEAAAPLQG